MARRRGKRANGEGTITQRADGRWTGQLSLGFDPSTGKRVRKTVYGDTQGEVRERLEALKGEYRDGPPVADSQMAFSAYLDLWLSSIKDTVAERSYDRYTYYAATLKHYLGATPLSDLTAKGVIRLYAKMAEDERSVADRFATGKGLRQALEAAIALGYVRTNVARKVPLPRPQRKEIHPLTPEEVRRFLDYVRRHRLYALFAVALDSGARAGELLALTWEDWNPATAELTITKTLQLLRGKLKVKEPKTRASRRKIVLSPAGAEAMEWQRSYQRAEGLVTRILFADTKGGYSRIHHITENKFHPLLKGAGLPQIRFHDLRHTTATLLLAAGVDPKTVAERLGHSSTKTLFETYAHVLPAMRQRAAAVLGCLLTGGSKVAVPQEPPVAKLQGNQALTRDRG